MRISWLAGCLLIGLLSLCKSEVTLEEYGEFEADNPEQLLYDLQLPDRHNYPEFPKLVFTTPWGKAGHKLTLKYAHKLEYVSPCWYSLKVGPKGHVVFENEHNFDKQWFDEMRRVNPKVKIVPRVYVQGGDVNVFQAIGSNKKTFTHAVSLIKRVVSHNHLDGIVWDTPFNFFEAKRADLNRLIVEFVTVIKEVMNDKVVMLNMANPLDSVSSLDIEAYRKLKIDHLLIQNYDKGDRYLDMVRASLAFKKKLNTSYGHILMLPFFSLSTTKGGVSSADVVATLLDKGVGLADVHNGICRFVPIESRQAYYTPCYTYFKRVFSLCKDEKVGFGFWQGGNGLQNYYRFL